MLNLDPAKLLVIGMVALIVLGPERLPRAARQAAGIWRELVRLRDQVSKEVRDAFPVEEIPRIPNVSRAISGTISKITATPDASTRPDDESTGVDEPARTDDRPRRTRRAPEVVVHPALGEFAFLPDDPSMN